MKDVPTLRKREGGMVWKCFSQLLIRWKMDKRIVFFVTLALRAMGTQRADKSNSPHRDGRPKKENWQGKMAKILRTTQEVGEPNLLLLGVSLNKTNLDGLMLQHKSRPDAFENIHLSLQNTFFIWNFPSD